MKIELNESEIQLIKRLLNPLFCVPQGLSPEFYRTLSWDGDMELAGIADSIVTKLNNQNSEAGDELS